MSACLRASCASRDLASARARSSSASLASCFSTRRSVRSRFRRASVSRASVSAAPDQGKTQQPLTGPCQIGIRLEYYELDHLAAHALVFPEAPLTVVLLLGQPRECRRLIDLRLEDLVVDLEDLRRGALEIGVISSHRRAEPSVHE